MATRYWVGGNGTWDAVNTANWSATSGGAGGASAPVAIDVVIIDANSGSGTCTTASGSICASSTLASATIILSLGDNHTQSGQFGLILGTVQLNTFILSCSVFSSNNSNNRLIDFGTSGQITLTGSGAVVWFINQLIGYSVAGSNPIVNLIYAGAVGTRTISTALNAVEASKISFNVQAGSDILALGNTNAVRDLNFTGFSGSFASSNHNVFGNLTLSSTMTVTAGTGDMSFLATSGTQQVTTNGVLFDRPIIFNGVGGTVVFQDALTQGSTRAFTITNGTVQLKNGVTSTVGAFATSVANQKFLESTLAGSQATLSQVSGTINASNLTIKDINATGGASFNSYTTNGNVDGGNNSGWDFNLLQLGQYIFTRRKNKRILP